jgi:hypothetical protein
LVLLVLSFIIIKHQATQQQQGQVAS